MSVKQDSLRRSQRARCAVRAQPSLGSLILIPEVLVLRAQGILSQPTNTSKETLLPELWGQFTHVYGNEGVTDTLISRDWLRRLVEFPPV